MNDGHSFASRRVTASQKGRAIFIAMISFQRPEHGHLQHQDRMPTVPLPDGLPSLVETMQEWARDERLSESVRAGIVRSSSFPFPIDLRRVDNAELSTRLSPQRPLQRCWMRVTGQLSNHLIVHQCALAYMSDWSILETALLPHGIHSYQNTTERQLQMASLDHSLYFHAGSDLLRADEWLLYVMESDWSGGGRGLTRGQFYDRNGTLIVSVVQEGLIRLRIAGQVQWKETATETDTGAAEGKAGRVKAGGSDDKQPNKKGGESALQGAGSDPRRPKRLSDSVCGGSGTSGGSSSGVEKQQSPSNHFTVLPSKL